jgi:beta-catenin-like protein 1
VEDEIEEDAEAGPELPPDFEEEPGNDEEGRFFGGGLASDTARAMDFLDERDQEGLRVGYIEATDLCRLED